MVSNSEIPDGKPYPDYQDYALASDEVCYFSKWLATFFTLLTMQFNNVVVQDGTINVDTSYHHAMCYFYQLELD